MFRLGTSRSLLARGRALLASRAAAVECRAAAVRGFSAAAARAAVRPYLLADVGEGIKECEVIQWMVQPGAHVEEFDPICELQSDKATVEITSRYAGTIKKLHYEVGQMAQVGDPLVDIDMADEAGAGAAEPVPAGASPTAPPVAGTGPDGAVPASSNVAPAPPSSPHAGNTAAPNAAPAGSAAPADPRSEAVRALATPAVRRVCRELNVDILQVTGTGKEGRVLKEDVQRFAAGEQAPAAAPSGAAPATPAAAAPAAAAEGSTIVPLTGVPKMMFKSMTRSAQIPHFMFADELEVDRLMALRARVNARLAASGAGLKLSYMPFLIKALSVALREYPIVNSRLLVEEQALEMRPQHNVSIAIDSPQGLVTPVIKDVGNRSVAEIGRELRRLQEAAAAGKLAPADFADGTITLSNIGSVGGTYVAPVVVESQVAIGGIGTIRRLPRFDEHDNVVPRNILTTSWCGDHRALDGATLASLVTRWKQLVENPDEMLLHLH